MPAAFDGIFFLHDLISPAYTAGEVRSVNHLTQRTPKPYAR